MINWFQTATPILLIYSFDGQLHRTYHIMIYCGDWWA